MTGEAITLRIGAKWTYKLELREESVPTPRTEVLLGRGRFNSEQEAKAADLKAEIEKRSC